MSHHTSLLKLLTPMAKNNTVKPIKTTMSTHISPKTAPLSMTARRASLAYVNGTKYAIFWNIQGMVASG